jgi:hypothetical protein
MTRETNLQIWQFIADGILRDCEPSYEQEKATEFIQKVAKDILAADKSNPSQRAEQIMKAVGLAGRLDAKEHSMRKAVELVDDFFSDLPQKEQLEIVLGIFRENLVHPEFLDDEERIRQIKTFLKKYKDQK